VEKISEKKNLRANVTFECASLVVCFVTNMSKLTRKGAAAAATATTTMDDDDAFDHQHNSSPTSGAEGERNSNSKVGKRKGSKNKMDKLYSSFKSNLTKKSTHSGGGGGENGTVEKEEENGEENSVDPRDLGDGLRRVEFPSSAKASYPKFENVEKEFKAMYKELEKSRDDKRKETEKMEEKMRRMVSAVEKEEEDEESAGKSLTDEEAYLRANSSSLRLHNRMFRITLYSSFQQMVTIAVVLYALLETADNWEGNSSIEKKGGTSWEVIQALHYIVSLIFFFEAGVKIMGAGPTAVSEKTGKETLVKWKPLDYFVNWENAVDFTILFFMSLNYISTWANTTLGDLTYDHIRVIRLFRLNRCVRYFRRNPEFKIILDGIGSGIASMGWVLVMLMIVMYIYAVLGTSLFYGLDPKNFRSLPYALNSGMGIATGSSWDEFLYATWYGCEHYGYPSPNDVDCPYRLNADGTKTYAKGNGVLSAIYVISMAFLVGNIMMSLFIGIITERMDQAYEAKETLKRKRIVNALRKTKGAIWESREKMNETLPEAAYTEVMDMMNLLSGSAQTQSMHEREAATENTWFQDLQVKLQKITQNDFFEYFVMGVIVFSAILSGYSTQFLDYSNPDASPPEWTEILERIFIFTFMIEFLIKIIGLWDKERTYYTGEDAKWNMFDAATTLVGFFGMVFEDSGLGGGSIAGFSRIVRLLRLARLFRFFKVIPQLNLIAKSLVLGVKSLKYVGTLMCFIFYTWAIAGVMLFSDNDPFFMRTLPVAFYHLFRVSQLESWANIVQINLEGCDKNRWGVNDGGAAYVGLQSNSGIHADRVYECDRPKAQPFVGSLYFYSFVVMCGMVIISVFIGVIVNGMHAATAESKIEFEREKRKEIISEHYELPASKLESIRRVWKRINWAKAKTIKIHQVEKLMEQLGVGYVPGYLHKVVSYWKPPPEGNPSAKVNEIDYPDFILIVCLLERAA